MTAFLIDCQARGLSPNTVRIYRAELRAFERWLHDLRDVLALSADHIRRYMLHLAETRNAGGQHIAYRVLKTFFRWYEREYEPDGWRNPIVRVSPPKVPQEPLAPLPLSDLKAMLDTCERRTFTGSRDRAMMLALLDTGCRASELLALGTWATRAWTRAPWWPARQGREVTRRLPGCQVPQGTLGVHAPSARCVARQPIVGDRHRLPTDHWGLRQVLRRRADKAGAAMSGPHAFRRAFALTCLRNAVDLISLEQLLGHADLTVIRRYLAQTEGDLKVRTPRGAGWTGCCLTDER